MTKEDKSRKIKRESESADSNTAKEIMWGRDNESEKVKQSTKKVREGECRKRMRGRAEDHPRNINTWTSKVVCAEPPYCRD